MWAVPSFVLTLYDNEMIQLKDEEPWYAAYTIIMILVIVISLFQCGLRGIWIGPLRFVLGTFIGALGAVGWILLIGVSHKNNILLFILKHYEMVKTETLYVDTDILELLI